MTGRYRIQAAADRLAQVLTTSIAEPARIAIVTNEHAVLTVRSRIVYDTLGEPTGELQVPTELRRRVLAREYEWDDPGDDMPRESYAVTDVRTGMHLVIVLER